MQLKDFKLLPKDDTGRLGNQAVLDFGKYHLSIIDDGYGKDRGLFEIGLFEAAEGVATVMTELPGITNKDDTIRGNLTEEDVNCILVKLYSITGTVPTQV